MIVFDGIELPNDNTRKCMVEARPEVSGSYKGFVYCQSLNEAREILDYFKGVVGEYISNKIPLSIKRGCSEFSLAYPDYDTLGKDDATPMEYKTEWREHETYTDQNLVGDLEPYAYDSYNHQGFELVDVLAMRDWIAYAAAIGDTSYLKLTGKAVEPLPNIDRPQFKPV